LVQTSHCQHASAITTPKEGLILILVFMLVEIDRRETAAALDQQQQQQNDRRPDVFQPQVQEVQTLVSSAVTHRTR